MGSLLEISNKSRYEKDQIYKLPSFIDRRNSEDQAKRICMTNHSSDDEDEGWLTQTEKIVTN